jgi:hypothetical protein
MRKKTVPPPAEPQVDKKVSYTFTRPKGTLSPEEFMKVAAEVQSAMVILLAMGAKDVKVQLFTGGSGRFYTTVEGQLP